MVGNDIVDLRDPDSDEATHPRRFDERVFAGAELRLMRESPTASRLRWRLWAAKEAAYKAARKGDPRVVFSPSRFQVENSSGDAGHVVHRREGAPPQRFDLRWWETDDAIHAVAISAAELVPGCATALVHGFRRLDPGASTERGSAVSAMRPSVEVRDFARQQLGAALEVPIDALEIRSSGRVPLLWLRDRPAAADLSLSHHGDWIAFACRIGVGIGIGAGIGAGDGRQAESQRCQGWAS